MTIGSQMPHMCLKTEGTAAITCLTTMIEDAVHCGDDAKVAKLDRVLRHVENMVDATAQPADNVVLGALLERLKYLGSQLLQRHH